MHKIFFASSLAFLAFFSIFLTLPSNSATSVPLHVNPVEQPKHKTKPELLYYTCVNVFVPVNGGLNILLFNAFFTLEKAKKEADYGEIKCIVHGHEIDVKDNQEPLAPNEHFFLSWIIKIDGSDNMFFEKFNSFEAMQNLIKAESVKEFRVNRAVRGFVVN